MRLAALVVSYNRAGQLAATLERLLAAPAAHLARLMVVDNASTDGTAALLAGCADPRLQVLRLAANRGGAGGFEAGIAALRAEGGYDWLVLMDDDARPEPGALAAFAAAERAGAEAWLAAAYHPDGRICEMNRPWTNPFWHPKTLLQTLISGRDGFHLGDAAYAAPARPVDGGAFVGLFLSARALELAGLPDGRLFLYGEDVLYTLALSAAGGRIRFDPGLVWEHDCATLAGDGAIRPLWRAYYFHRNQVLVYRRAAGPLLFWPVLALKWLAWRRGARRYGAERAAFLAVLRQAVSDALARRFVAAPDGPGPGSGPGAG
jgi:GT2 family glycosyltransferase